MKKIGTRLAQIASACLLALSVSPVAFAAEESASLGETMAQAGMNTLMGICIVFLVLILISLIISLLKYVPALVDQFSGKKKQEEVQSVDRAIQQIEEQELEEDLVDDGELVAVITAAIMASMGDEAPSDGLVVRSIKRKNVKNWQNA
ncbi:MAG: OadG family protein [Clostridiales bacterium]|nr:OadG family protein [Clostridiales bacterium]